MTMSRAWTRNETSVPPWAAVAFAAVLTLVGCTDAFAQRALPPPPTGLIVTDVKGAVALAETGGPVAILENLRPGTVLKVPEGAKVELFDPPSATVHSVPGPARLVVQPGAPKLESGKAAPPRKVAEAYRRLRIDNSDVITASMRLRGADGRVVEGPEGFVATGDSRTFRWKARAGIARFEIATVDGDLVHRARVTGTEYRLPDSVKLIAGAKYVWGVGPAAEKQPPFDWTEFAIRDDPKTPRPPASGASEWRLYLAWLRAMGMTRAADRLHLRHG